MSAVQGGRQVRCGFLCRASVERLTLVCACTDTIALSASSFVLDRILSGQSRDDVVLEIHNHLRQVAQNIKDNLFPLRKVRTALHRILTSHMVLSRCDLTFPCCYACSSLLQGVLPKHQKSTLMHILNPTLRWHCV